MVNEMIWKELPGIIILTSISKFDSRSLMSWYTILKPVFPTVWIWANKALIHIVPFITKKNTWSKQWSHLTHEVRERWYATWVYKLKCEMIKNNCTLVTQKKCNEDQTTIKLNSLVMTIIHKLYLTSVYAKFK